MNNIKFIKSQTRFTKSIRGNQAKTTYRNLKGYDWEITTMKSAHGMIFTVAQAGKFSENGLVFTYQIFREPVIKLSQIKARATQKNILEAHKKSLNEFEERQINNIS